MDQHSAPFSDALARFTASDAVTFSTPGHKRGRTIDPTTAALLGSALSADIPHGGGVDTTHFNLGILRQAEHLAAQAYGADDARYLVNGSTTGNIAMLLATCRDGDEVIITRMLHKSLLAALIFSGAQPIYLTPTIDPDHNLPLDTDPQTVAGAIRAHPNARAVVLVSPSYVGVTSDLGQIAEICHNAGIPLLVDEAWGPHFHFHPQLPQSATAAGADAAVNSSHKMTSAITQGSTLLLRHGLLDLERIHPLVDMVQTTSPSVLIYASLDTNRRLLATQGHALLDRTITLARHLRQALEAIPGLTVLSPEIISNRPGADFDVTRVLVDVAGLGITGFEAEQILRDQHGVHVEMSDLLSVLLLITIGDDEATIQRAIDAFQSLARFPTTDSRFPTAQLRSSGQLLFGGQQACTPRQAFNAPHRAVPPAQAIGQISAESITPYPPGIPLITPGERIRPEVIDYLRQGLQAGMHLSGLSDPTFQTIRILT